MDELKEKQYEVDQLQSERDKFCKQLHRHKSTGAVKVVKQKTKAKMHKLKKQHRR